jgi:hypothetical protein
MKSKLKEKSKKATAHPTQRHWNEMNRKQRRETMRKIQSEDLSLEVLHPDAAGIDIGNESHYVAVPSSRDNQPVRRFGCTTAELKAMATWLKQCGIRTVANPLACIGSPYRRPHWYGPNPHRRHRRHRCHDRNDGHQRNRIRYEHGPPLCGGCMTLKLVPRDRHLWCCPTKIRGTTWLGS